MATLEDLEDVLTSMNKSITEQTGFIKSLFELQNKNSEEERRRRERERADRTRIGPGPGPGPSGDIDRDALDRGAAAGESFIGAFLGASGILASIQGLAAGAASLSLALTGFTGWEKDIIKSIGGGFKAVSDIVSSGVLKLRNSILTRFFGFDVEGSLIRDPLTGRFATAGSVTDQIAKRIDNLRIKALSVFGLGADGRSLLLRGEDGRFTGTSIVGRITNAVRTILSPLKTVAEGVTGFITGAGKGIWDFISPYIGKAGAFVGLVGKILKPIGIIFSAWEGINAYMDKEGTIFEKFGAGISTFVADFVGVPFDLIKNGMLWIVKKFFPGLTTTDGSFDQSTIMGRVLQLASDFSIADTIKYLVEAPFKIITEASNWISGKITWIESEAEELTNTFKDKVDSIKNSILSLPEKAKMVAQETFDNIEESVREGFTDFGNWLSSIPARIKLFALETIKNASSRLEGLGIELVSDQQIADARRSVDTGISTSSMIRPSQTSDMTVGERELLRAGSSGQKPVVILNAPNQSTTTYNTQGGSSSSTLITTGGGGLAYVNDLDGMLPRGIF